MTTGAFTWAVLLRVNAYTSSSIAIMWADSGVQTRGAVNIGSSGALSANVSTSIASPSTAMTVPTGAWVLLAVSKPSGTAAVEFQMYRYDTDAWTRFNSTSSFPGDATALANMGIGGHYLGANYFGGDIAAAAAFAVQLTDDQVASLTVALSAWTSLGPAAMWVLDQQATSQQVNDWAGGGARQSGIAGTTVSANSVPILGYGHPVVVRTRQQAPPSLRALGTPVGTTTNTPSFAAPAGAQASDVILVPFFADDGRRTISSVPTNFTLASDLPQTNDASAGPTSHSLYVYWGRYSDVGAGPYSFTLSGTSAFVAGRTAAIQNCVATGNPFEAADGASSGNASVTTAPAVSATSTDVNRYAFYAATNWTSGAWTPASGYAEQWDANDRVLTLDDLLLPTAATTSPQAVCAASARSNAWVGLMLPLGATVGTGTTLTVQPAGAVPAGAPDIFSLGTVLADQPGSTTPAGAPVALNAATAMSAQPGGTAPAGVASTFTPGTQLSALPGGTQTGGVQDALNLGLIATAQPGGASPAGVSATLAAGTLLAVQPAAASPAGAQSTVVLGATLTAGAGGSSPAGTQAGLLAGIILSATPSGAIPAGATPTITVGSATATNAQPGVALTGGAAAALNAGTLLAVQPSGSEPAGSVATVTLGTPGAFTLIATPGGALPGGIPAQQATGTAVATQPGTALPAGAASNAALGILLTVGSAVSLTGASPATSVLATALTAIPAGTTGGSGSALLGAATILNPIPGITLPGSAPATFTARQALNPLTGGTIGGGTAVTLTGSNPIVRRPGVLTPGSTRSDPTPGTLPYPRLTAGTLRGPAYSGGG